MAYVEDIVVHHHPSPSREDPAQRQVSIVRSKFLTAVMRRPWPFVLRETLRHLRSGPTGRAGIRAGLPHLGAAIRGRCPVPRSVEAGLMQLREDVEFTGGAGGVGVLREPLGDSIGSLPTRTATVADRRPVPGFGFAWIRTASLVRRSRLG